MTDDIRSRDVPAPDLLNREAGFKRERTQNRPPEPAEEAPVAEPVQVENRELPTVPSTAEPREPRVYANKSERLVKIEEKLSDDIALFYWGLPEEKREPFKAKGEALARTVEQCIEGKNFQPHKVHAEVMSWLRMIGVNQWWLAQEGDILMKKIAGWVENGEVN